MLPNLARGEDVFDSPELRTKMRILHAVDKSLDRITIALAIVFMLSLIVLMIVYPKGSIG